ncbi:MAG: hypothetical protein ACFB2Y_08040 [Fulvivirga sp.]
MNTDDLGDDEVRVIFLRDDEPARRMSKDLNNGEKLNIEGTYEFKDVFTIKVYDDEVAADDFLGQFRIHKPSTGTKTVNVSTSSSKYQLKYTIAKKP